jgi:hypothetical protein
VTSDPRAPAPAAPRPGAAQTLRRIALHEETAALLQQRAGRAGSPAAAGSLRRRAAEHARHAAELRAGLAARRGAAPRAAQPDRIAGG